MRARSNVRRESISCKSGRNAVRGTLLVPEGAGPFPLLVYSHGYGYNMEVVDLERIAAHGVACCRFDFCGGSPFSRSGGRSTEMSVLTEARDLEAVMDLLLQDPRIDPGRVYLAGNSQGGFVSIIVAIERKRQVRGLFPMCPALVIADFRERYLGGGEPPRRMRIGNMTISRRYVEDAEDYHVFERMPEYGGPVVLFHGTADELVPIEYSRRAAKAFPHARLVEYPGEGHMLSGVSRQIEDVIMREIDSRQ